MAHSLCESSFFFFNAPATTEIYTLSLHDALPISYHHRRSLGCELRPPRRDVARLMGMARGACTLALDSSPVTRSEEHTSELQSHSDLVCRLLLEKKKT